MIGPVLSAKQMTISGRINNMASDNVAFGYCSYFQPLLASIVLALA